MDDVVIWHDYGNNKVFVRGEGRTIKVDPLVVKAFAVEQSRLASLFDQEKDTLKRMLMDKSREAANAKVENERMRRQLELDYDFFVYLHEYEAYPSVSDIEFIAESMQFLGIDVEQEE